SPEAFWRSWGKTSAPAATGCNSLVVRARVQGSSAAARGTDPRAPSTSGGSELLGVLGQVLRDAFGSRLHALGALVPACRAHFPVLLGELEGIDHAQHLVDVAAEGQIVDHLMTHDARLVDQ